MVGSPGGQTPWVSPVMPSRGVGASGSSPARPSLRETYLLVPGERVGS